VTNGYNALNRELGLPTPPPSPETYLPQFASELELGLEVERRAHEVLEIAGNQVLANGRDPTGVAAASLLVAAREVGSRLRLTQRAIADVAEVTTKTLRRRRDELLAASGRPAP
jgi:transcription initiation factor TFIIB